MNELVFASGSELQTAVKGSNPTRFRLSLNR